jgi:hypothetical protein
MTADVGLLRSVEWGKVERNESRPALWKGKVKVRHAKMWPWVGIAAIWSLKRVTEKILEFVSNFKEANKHLCNLIFHRNSNENSKTNRAHSDSTDQLP